MAGVLHIRACLVRPKSEHVKRPENVETTMLLLEKLEGSRGPYFTNLEELKAVLNYLSAHEGNPPPSYWTSTMFDGNNWKDYTTGEILDIGGL